MPRKLAVVWESWIWNWAWAVAVRRIAARAGLRMSGEDSREGLLRSGVRARSFGPRDGGRSGPSDFAPAYGSKVVALRRRLRRLAERPLQLRSNGKGKGNKNGNDENTGSLHCALRAARFGRDDDVVGGLVVTRWGGWLGHCEMVCPVARAMFWNS